MISNPQWDQKRTGKILPCDKCMKVINEAIGKFGPEDEDDDGEVENLDEEFDMDDDYLEFDPCAPGDDEGYL